MRETFYTLIFLLCLSINCQAMSPAMLGCAGGAAGCTATTTEAFAAADNADVAGNSAFDAEVDLSSKLAISTNKMAYDSGTGATAYVTDTSTLSNASEVTIKFKITFDDVVGIDNGTSALNPIMLYDDANTESQGWAYFNCVDGNLATYYITLTHAGGTAQSSPVTMTGVAADTEYDVVIYFKKDASTGGASMKVGAWAATTTGFNEDNSGKAGVGTIRFGGANCYWGDGTTDTIVRFDNYEVYACDKR